MNEKEKSLPRSWLQRQGFSLLVFLMACLPLLYLAIDFRPFIFRHLFMVYAGNRISVQRVPSLFEQLFVEGGIFLAVLSIAWLISRLAKRIHFLFTIVFFAILFGFSGLWWFVSVAGWADSCLSTDGSGQMVNYCEMWGSCQNMFDELYGVKAEYENPSTHTTRSAISLTQNGGQTWKPFFIGNGFLSTAGCGNFTYKSGGFFWLTVENFLAITHDGGQTWHYWNSDMIDEIAGTIYDQYGYIIVNFTDSKNGTLVQAVSYTSSNFDIPVLTLTTNDGGSTWKLPDSEAAKIEKAR